MYSPKADLPQVNFPKQKGQKVNGRKVSETPFQEYLKKWETNIRREQEKLRKLLEISVTLHRRFRGLTLSDLVGRYGVRRNTDGKWIDYDADLDGDIHPINIVQPAMRANTNACLQSHPQLEIQSANQSAKDKNIAMRWQRVADFFARANWTEAERTILFDSVQKNGTVLLYSYANKTGSKSAPDIIENKHHLAAFKCGCGANGIVEAGETDGMQSIPCPKCGKEAKAVVRSYQGFDLEETSVDEYEINHKIFPFFNFIIDRYGARLGGLQTAKWLQIHELIDRVELETAHPHIDFGSPTRWSFALQVDYALANSDWRFLNYSPSQDRTYQDFDKFEQKSIYLHEEAYTNYIAPDKYDFVDGRGKRIFSIERGQTITEAFDKMYGMNPKGLKFKSVDERVIEICSPENEELNFRECFSDVHWLRDSSSYYSAPYHSISIVQDDITLLNTMNHNIIARNAVNQVYYDSLVFEKADFSKEYVGTKNAHLLPDRNVDKAITQLPVPTPSPHLANQLEFLMGVKDTITQVQPALRGDAQPGETYGAQRQQREQAYGMLTSVLKSHAKCLGDSFKQKARVASEKWTLEQFQEVGSSFGEIWTEDDIAEMVEVDFEKDLIVSYKSGSEIPQSRFDQVIEFQQGLQNLAPFVQSNPELLGTDKLTKILQKIDEYAEFDFDLTGLEVNEALAQKRFIELAELTTEYGEVGYEQIEAAKQNVVGVTPEGEPITSFDVLIEQLFYRSRITFSEYEDLEQQRAFLVEQFRSESGKTNPNYLLIELLQFVLQALDANMAVEQQEAIQNDPEYQLMQEKLRAEQEADANEDEREDRHRQEDFDNEDYQAKRDFAQDVTMKRMDQQFTREMSENNEESEDKPKKDE